MRLIATFIASLAVAAAGFADKFEELKRTAAPAELYRFLYAMPKGGDIHMHFGLSSWAEEWYDAAKDRFYTRIGVSGCKPESIAILFDNISKSAYDALSACEKADYRSIREVPKEQWISSLIVDQPGEGRDEFFERIVDRVREMNRDPSVAVAAFEQSLKRWAAEGVRYVEIAAQPPTEAYLASLKRAAANAPIVVRYQGMFIRYVPEAETRLVLTAKFVSQNPDYWVGMNMAGREDNDKGYALRFLEPFRKMRRQHPRIRLSLHAGEVDSPGREVRNTLQLGAERIGHGVNLISDPDTMLLLRHGRTLIETNLVSNKLLGYTPDLKLHPFIEYLRFGIPVCLNTDDQGSWDSSLTDEYFEAIRAFDLTWDEVVHLGRNSLEYSFAPADLKKKLLADFEAAIRAFENSESWRTVKPVISGYARRSLLN